MIVPVQVKGPENQESSGVSSSWSLNPNAGEAQCPSLKTVKQREFSYSNFCSIQAF